MTARTIRDAREPFRVSRSPRGSVAVRRTLGPTRTDGAAVPISPDSAHVSA